MLGDRIPTGKASKRGTLVEGGGGAGEEGMKLKGILKTGRRKQEAKLPRVTFRIGGVEERARETPL